MAIAVDPEPSGERRLRAEKIEPVQLNWGRQHLRRVAADREKLAQEADNQERAMALAAYEIVARYRAFVARWLR